MCMINWPKWQKDKLSSCSRGGAVSFFGKERNGFQMEAFIAIENSQKGTGL